MFSVSEIVSIAIKRIAINRPSVVFMFQYVFQVYFMVLILPSSDNIS